jgi:hypothetical protein
MNYWLLIGSLSCLSLRRTLEERRLRFVLHTLRALQTVKAAADSHKLGSMDAPRDDRNKLAH